MIKFKNRYTVFIMLLIISSITIISASFNETLILNGEAYVRADADIRITDVYMSSSTNGAYETYNLKYTKDTTKLFLTLPSLSSTITYNIEVTNKTSYGYIISNINKSLSNTNMTYTIDYTKYDIISGSSTYNIKVTFMYNSSITTMPSDTTNTVSFGFTFIRPSAEILAYDNTTSGSECTDVQCALDELYTLYGG